MEDNNSKKDVSSENSKIDNNEKDDSDKIQKILLEIEKKNISINNESTKQKNNTYLIIDDNLVNIGEYRVLRNNISDADINRIKLKTEIMKNYQSTDTLLSTQLEKSFSVLDGREKAKRKLKYTFFTIIMFVFLILTISPILLIYHLSGSVSELTLIISFTGSIVELIIAIIKLPEIIAEYLFNKEEDKLYFDLINDLKDYHNSRNERFK